MATETPAEDVVNRLRDQAHMTQRDGLNAMFGTANTAADEITRLRAEKAELQRKLDEAVRALKPFADRAVMSDGTLKHGFFTESAQNYRSAHTALTSIRG